MTSATIRQTRDASRGEGYWMIVFAATLLGVVGIFNLIDGIAAIANSHIFIANAHYVVGDLRAWGWVALILGALQVLASIAVVVGNQAARWFAVAVIGLNAIGQMFFIPAYPFWSLMIIALDVVALWGLCAYGSRENALLGPDNLPNEPPGWTWRQTSIPGGARRAAWGRKPGSGFPWRGRARCANIHIPERRHHPPMADRHIIRLLGKIPRFKQDNRVGAIGCRPPPSMSRRRRPLAGLLASGLALVDTPIRDPLHHHLLTSARPLPYLPGPRITHQGVNPGPRRVTAGQPNWKPNWQPTVTGAPSRPLPPGPEATELTMIVRWPGTAVRAQKVQQ